MNVLVLGAGGIIGQSLRLCQPEVIEATYVRQHADPISLGIDLSEMDAVLDLLETHRPDVIINLAGENRPDRCCETTWAINVTMPELVAQWAADHDAVLLHVSSQAVFDGDHPPYGPDSPRHAVNEYGAQKIAAEDAVMKANPYGAIVRLTFALGVRPLPFVGRANPLEEMFEATQQRQVHDRWFSPMLADRAAEQLWELAAAPKGMMAALDGERWFRRVADRPIHLGLPTTTNRFHLAMAARSIAIGSQGTHTIHPVPHESFSGLVERPVNTTYRDTEPTEHPPSEELRLGLGRAWKRMQARLDLWDPIDRAEELALFLGQSVQTVETKLTRGFSVLHAESGENWRRMVRDRTDEQQVLTFYRRTETYLWELTSYHLDRESDYAELVKEIPERIIGDTIYDTGRVPGAAISVLVLGDGIGDLTLALRAKGLDAVYHDLAGSRTAAFADFRAWRHGVSMPALLSSGFDPEAVQRIDGKRWDAIVVLDFFEHLPNVEAWARACHAALRPGGLFVAQNGFAIGSPDHGDSIPMHLAVNDHYDQDWAPLMRAIGFESVGGIWWKMRD
jgi:dTDP-4-dehydrorhamnose reductase/2-polyprenyl-3-methyl-5-hydroxy-6-metoxy-1,4-benzoquinol methylase